MSRPAVDDPCSNLNFLVKFDGIAIEGFCHVSGLESLVEIVEGKSPNAGPGDQSWGNVILRRAVDERRDLWDWYQSTLNGEKVCRDAQVVILNAAGETFLRIQVRQAWPCRWRLTALDALHPEVLLEELELVIESFHVK